MIFDNIRFPFYPTKSGRQLVQTTITFNSNQYEWSIYVPILEEESLNSYLSQISNIVQSDIEHKENIWLNSPHTETINDPFSGTILVDIPKERIVCPTVPDYVEALLEYGPTNSSKLQEILNKFPSSYWHYPRYVKRIIAPINMMMDDVGVKMYNWFQINNLPILKLGNTVQLYCNTILPEHQSIVDSLSGIINIEDRP